MMTDERSHEYAVLFHRLIEPFRDAVAEGLVDGETLAAEWLKMMEEARGVRAERLSEQLTASTAPWFEAERQEKDSERLEALRRRLRESARAILHGLDRLDAVQSQV